MWLNSENYFFSEPCSWLTVLLLSLKGRKTRSGYTFEKDGKSKIKSESVLQMSSEVENHSGKKMGEMYLMI